MASTTLKILREINNYSQEYIAEDVLGISQPTYARLEQNPPKITAEQAQKLSALYNISVASLLSETAPIITFKDSINENVNGSNGYNTGNTHHYNEGEVIALKAEIDFLRKQNADLLKMVGEKLAGS